MGDVIPAFTRGGAAQGSLVFESDADVVEIGPGEAIQHAFRYQNQGTAPVRITAVRTSAGEAAQVVFPDRPIFPRDVAGLLVTVEDPARDRRAGRPLRHRGDGGDDGRGAAGQVAAAAGDDAGRRVSGRVAQVSVSPRGGVPKRAVAEAAVGPLGLAGDAVRYTKIHGGPERAVCLFSLDLIERLREEGHPSRPARRART